MINSLTNVAPARLLCLWFHASHICINNCPTKCNTKQSICYSAGSLYVFRVSTTPIIRNTQNCNYSLRYWSLVLQLPPSNVAEIGYVGGRWLHKNMTFWRVYFHSTCKTLQMLHCITVCRTTSAHKAGLERHRVLLCSLSSICF